MSISILSAIYGDYDTVKPVMEQTVPVDDWIMVTDNADLEAPGWTVVYEPRPHMHPCLAAKVPKFRPDLYSASENTLWVDASFTYEPTMAQMALDGLSASSISLFPHPHRTTIAAEMELSLTLLKYAHLPLREQVAEYRSQGYRDQGLWATGVLAMEYRPYMPDFGNAWMAECVRWSYQDQISLPYVLAQNCIEPSPIGQSQFTSPHVHLGGHK